MDKGDGSMKNENDKYWRIGIFAFAMIGITTAAAVNGSTIGILVGLAGVPLLSLPYMIEDWYLPYRREKKEREKEQKKQAAKAEKQAAEAARQAAEAAKKTGEAAGQGAETVKAQNVQYTAQAQRQQNAEAVQRQQNPEGHAHFYKGRFAQMLCDLQISDEPTLSGIFGYDEMQLKELTEKFFSGSGILSADGKTLTQEEKIHAMRQILSLGQQFDRKSEKKSNYSKYVCRPGNLRYAYHKESVESHCYDGGNCMPDGYDDYYLVLKFCYASDKDWDRDILPEWKEKLQIFGSTEQNAIKAAGQERQYFGYNGTLENDMIHAAIPKYNGMYLYLKDPFGMKGVFCYEWCTYKNEL